VLLCGLQAEPAGPSVKAGLIARGLSGVNRVTKLERCADGRPVSTAAHNTNTECRHSRYIVSAKAIQAGGVEAHLHSFLISAPDGGEWANLNATRLAAGDRTQVSGSIPVAVRTFCSRETSRALAGIRTTTALSAGPQSAGNRSYLLIHLLFV